MIFQEGDVCKGCSLGHREHEHTQCRINERGKAGECPCLKCILKSSCTAICPPWVNLSKSVSKIVV